MLAAALVAAGCTFENSVVGAHAQHHGRERQHVVVAALRLAGIDGRGRRVLGDVQVQVALGIARAGYTSMATA